MIASIKAFVRLLALMLALAGGLAAAQTIQPAPVIPAAQPAAGVPAATVPSAAIPTPDNKVVSLSDGYVLGVGDVVEIAVLGRDEFHPRVQVQTDGTIQLPYLHSVAASDLTVLQLRDKIAKLLRDGGYYTDPVVNVSVVSYASRYVTVLGQFGNPGLIPVDRSYHVSEILARAGGAKPDASDELLLRRADGSQLKLSLEGIASGGPDEDPVVHPGDKLYLAESPLFYVYGQVGAPGAYHLTKDMSVRMALARSGGLTDRGSTGRISVYRDGQKIKADLDTKVQPQDTIRVGERFF